ncbi:AI-2E family transporter [Pilimelia columellifera]|uniref:AI-2E family transporter n=1 Tax=Pilimelia columellifera subsp. columellifera TaxID=706583 RepID=A0ABN3NDL6_9ACTN
MPPAAARTTAQVTLTVIGLVLATLLGLGLLYAAHQVIVWMVVAAFFATALNPLANLLERRVRWCRRWLATLLVFLLVFVLLAGLLALFVIPLSKEAAQLAQTLPDLVRDTWAGRGPLARPMERLRVREYLAEHGDQIQSYLSSLAAPTLGFLRGAATTVVAAVTIFVLAYVMVLQSPGILDGLQRLLPVGQGERARRVGARCAGAVTGYLSGNLLISLICGVLTYAVLAILNVPYAGLIALFVAVADLIPLVGATLGAVVAGLAAFSQSMVAGIVVLVFFVAYQQVENHLLQPVIFARTVQLSPLAVLVAILIAVELAGILGALLAIPVAGMVKVIATEVWAARAAKPGTMAAASQGALTDAEPTPTGSPTDDAGQ